ncbi:MAG: GNAT family N-acetyltransferase [Anaerolineales bacterium]
MEPVIRRLKPELLPDYLAFFDLDAFRDNPDWAGCYCYFFHADHASMDFEDRSGKENRAEASRLIGEGKLQGYLAYLQDQVIGWCQAAARPLIPNLQKDGDLPQEDIERLGAIVCFVISPSHRGQGVGGRLLASACEGLREDGMTVAEAYPRQGAGSAAANYHGPMAMYRKAGFELYREFEDYWIVRKQL